MALYDGGTYVGISAHGVAVDETIITAAADESIVVYWMSLIPDTVGLYTVTWGVSGNAEYITSFTTVTDTIGFPVVIDLSQAFARGDFGDNVIIDGPTSSKVDGTIVYAIKKQAS